MIALRDATDRSLYGGKAAGLAEALRAGLPVPDGLALSWEEGRFLTSHPTESSVSAQLSGDAFSLLTPGALRELGAVSVRSSAVDEDGAGASFAGQHKTHVNVRGADAIGRAIADVVASARSASALAYRAKLGLTAEPRMAVVIQRLVAADCAGVLFTRHPATGTDERVVEAAWGLGETVVAGLVTPDIYRWSRSGARLETRIGHKEIAIRPAEHGCEEVEVAAALVRARVLTDGKLAALEDLAVRCEKRVGAAVDLEWAFVGERVYLLQCRPVTATTPR